MRNQLPTICLLIILATHNAAQSWLSCPQSFDPSPSRFGNTDGPCEAGIDDAPITTFNAGDRIKVGWPSNNIGSGSVRLAIVPISDASNQSAFDENVLKQTCFGYDQRPNFFGFGFCVHPCNGRPGCEFQSDVDDSERYDTTLTIPYNLAIGEYVLQWIGITGNSPNIYFSCAKLQINGGDTALNCAAPATIPQQTCAMGLGPSDLILTSGSNAGQFCFNGDSTGLIDDAIATKPVNFDCDPRVGCSPITKGAVNTQSCEKVINGIDDPTDPRQQCLISTTTKDAAAPSSSSSSKTKKSRTKSSTATSTTETTSSTLTTTSFYSTSTSSITSTLTPTTTSGDPTTTPANTSESTSSIVSTTSSSSNINSFSASSSSVVDYDDDTTSFSYSSFPTLTSQSSFEQSVTDFSSYYATTTRFPSPTETPTCSEKYCDAFKHLCRTECESKATLFVNVCYSKFNQPNSYIEECGCQGVNTTEAIRSLIDYSCNGIGIVTNATCTSEEFCSAFKTECRNQCGSKASNFNKICYSNWKNPLQYIAKCVCSGSDVTGPITKSARTTCGKCPTTVKKGASCSTGKRICSGANVARCHKGKWKIRECSGDRFCQVHNQNGKCSKPKGILNPCSNSVGQGGSSISIPTTQATGSSPTLVDPAFISVVSVFSTVFVTSCDRATATTEQGSGATSIVIPPPYFYSEAGYGDYSVPVPSTSKTSSLSRKTRSRSRTRRLSTTSSAFGSGNTDVPIPSIPETCTESASEIGSGQTTVAIPSSSSVLATPTCKTEASGSGNTDVSLPSLTSPLSRHHSKSRHHHLKSSSADYGSGNTDVSIPSSTVCITLTSTILGSGNSDFSVPTDAPSYTLHRSRHHYWNHSTELNYYSFPTSEAEGSAQTSLVAPPSFATSTACDYCGRFKKACRVYCRNVSKGADFALVNQCYNEFSSCVCNGVDLSIGIESEVDEQAPEEQTC